LESGEVVPYASIKVGDRVESVNRLGQVFYDKVFRITHHEVDTTNDYVRLTTASGAKLELTESHMLHVGACCDVDKLVSADEVQVGDSVFVMVDGVATPSAVTKVEMVKSKGMYNVHTLHGNIVVNGVVASHFTDESTWASESRHLSSAWYHMVDMKNAVVGNAEDASVKN